MTRVALDSNILAYFAGVTRTDHDIAKIDLVRQLIGQLSAATTLVAPAQTVGELFVVWAALCFSEDMQHGFVTRGPTIINPFAENPHSKLTALLAS